MSTIYQCDGCKSTSPSELKCVSVYNPKTDKADTWDLCDKCLGPLLTNLPAVVKVKASSRVINKK